MCFISQSNLSDAERQFQQELRTQKQAASELKNALVDLQYKQNYIKKFKDQQSNRYRSGISSRPSHLFPSLRFHLGVARDKICLCMSGRMVGWVFTTV